MEEERLRFSGLPWFPSEDKQVLIEIGGAGGIGSWTAFFLSRIGYNVRVIDYDRVESHNLSGQIFAKNSVGKPKVAALKDSLDYFNGSVRYESIVEAITEHFITQSPYTISAFDNMVARTNLFNSFITYCDNYPYLVQQAIDLNDGMMNEAVFPFSNEPLFIDGRLEAEQLQIYCVRNTPEDIQRYRETLFSDNLVADAPCSFKQTSHNAALIGSLIVGLFTNHLTNVKEGEAIRSVPFRTDFYVPFMNFETQ